MAHCGAHPKRGEKYAKSRQIAPNRAKTRHAPLLGGLVVNEFQFMKPDRKGPNLK